MAEDDYTDACITTSGYVDSDTPPGYVGNTWTTWIQDDYTKAYREQIDNPRKHTLEEVHEKLYGKQIKIEGVDIMVLYDVYLVYAEDRKNPIVINRFGVIARNEEDAKIKSGLMKEVQDNWDADYLNFIVKEIGDVKVKERPKEVRHIK